MSYQVLARKWRPQRFDDVVGQQAVTRTLRYARTNLERHPRFARLQELLGAHIDELS